MRSHSTFSKDNEEICKSFGIDPSKVTRVALILEAGEEPRLEVDYLFFERGTLGQTLKRYKLVEISEDSDEVS